MSPSLPAELTIYTLGGLHQQWLGWLAKLPKSRKSTAATLWPVEASAVYEVDAAGVQLLLALAHSLSLKRRTLQLVNPSSQLASACDALGVATLLMVGNRTDGST